MSTPSKKIIHVAVGIVMNADNQILLAKRADHQHQGGLWEFPGGKVEQGESVMDALVREFKEEVNITITRAQAFMTISHDYGDKAVMLDVWLSREFTGDANGNENQPIAWVPVTELAGYDFPQANQAIIEKLITEFVDAPSEVTSTSASFS